MKRFFEEYGNLTLIVIIIILIISLVSPVGSKVKSSITGLITQFSGTAENVTDVNGNNASNLVTLLSGGNAGPSYEIVDGDKDGLHYHNDELFTGNCSEREYEEGKPVYLIFPRVLGSGYKAYLLTETKVSGILLDEGLAEVGPINPISNLTVTISEPSTLYFWLICANADQKPGGALPIPYALNYAFRYKIGAEIYNVEEVGRPSITSTGGEIECGQVEITEEMLTGGPIDLILEPYVTNYPEKTLADFGENAQRLLFGYKLIK